MKKLETITEYQLLFAEGQTKQSLRRTKALLKMYYEQESEILNRMGEINNGNAE